jgi:hypothetical protein
MNPQQPHPAPQQPYPPQQMSGGRHSAPDHPTPHPAPPGRQLPPMPPAAAPKKRRKWPWIVLAVVVLLGLVIATSSKGGGAPPATNGSTPSAAAAPAAPAPRAAQAASAPTNYAGKGDDVVTIAKDSGPAIVTFECARCSGNTVLQSDGADALLVNTIGSYSGRHLIDPSDGSVTSTLTVKATGSWKITVASGLASATRADTSVSGHGDDVAVLTGDVRKAAITNKGGNSNFVVRAYDGSGIPDLAVNVIGGYSGTVPINGPVVLAISSTGNWTVTGS